MNWTQIINDWGLLSGIIIAGMSIVSFRRYKARRSEKKHKEKIESLNHLEHLEGNLTHTKLNNPMEPTIPQPPEVKLKEVDEDLDVHFAEIFGEIKNDPKKVSEDTLKNFQDIFLMVEKSSERFDTDMTEKFESLQKELKEVHERRKQIKELGLNLSKYYKKYLKREKQLTGIMMGLETVLSKQYKKEGNQNDTRIDSQVPGNGIPTGSETQST